MFYTDPWFYTTIAACGGFVLASAVACHGYLKHWHTRALDVAAMRRTLDQHRTKVAASNGTVAPVKVETPFGHLHWTPRFNGKVGK